MSLVSDYCFKFLVYTYGELGKTIIFEKCWLNKMYLTLKMLYVN